MKKLSKILIVGVFLAGFIVSIICLACNPRIVMSCCHNKVQLTSTRDESCLSHCAKQKTFAVNVNSQLSAELKNQNASPAPVNLQTIPTSLEINTAHYINQSIIKLNTGQIYFTPLFNHSPPRLL